MRTVAGKVLAEVEKAFIGKEDVTRSVLLAMIAGGMYFSRMCRE